MQSVTGAYTHASGTALRPWLTPAIASLQGIPTSESVQHRGLGDVEPAPVVDSSSSQGSPGGLVHSGDMPGWQQPAAAGTEATPRALGAEEELLIAPDQPGQPAGTAPGDLQTGAPAHLQDPGQAREGEPSADSFAGGVPAPDPAPSTTTTTTTMVERLADGSQVMTTTTIITTNPDIHVVDVPAAQQHGNATVSAELVVTDAGTQEAVAAPVTPAPVPSPLGDITADNITDM